MRKILTLLFVTAALAAAAQSSNTVTLYGYGRPSHPGIVPPGRKNATLMDYRVYIAHPEGRFRILEVRIGGKRYDFRTERVASPVTEVNRNLPQNPRTDTLVPPTSRVVDQLLLPHGPVRPGAGALQVRYSWNGKKFTRTLKSWKELEPVLQE
ncbi:MAG: hypothetical protein EOO15_04630 [Chitinophagaceae bacterium]|nr:MAG: hypothetical protein EOO15_04630 [Chitinophagaceae bacterium]